MGAGDSFIGLLVVGAVVLGIVLLALWIALPFAIFGVKPLLQHLLDEQRRTNALMQAMIPPASPSAPHQVDNLTSTRK